MKRLFTFGCSFTYYGAIPTYPWFLAKNFDESYNFGMPGGGNEYVFHSLIEADSQFNLTSDDTVIIVWTGIFRIDMPRKQPIDNNYNYIWEGNGDWEYYQGKLTQIKQFYTEDFLIHKTFNYITMAKRYLEAKKINYKFSSIYDLRIESHPLANEIYDDNFIEKMGLVKYIIEYNQPRIAKNIPVFSGHPSFSVQYKFAKLFAKSLSIALPDEVDEWRKLEETIHIEQNVYDRYEVIKKHPLYNKVYENLVRRYNIDNYHRIFPNFFKFNKESSNLYKQILLDVFA